MFHEFITVLRYPPAPRTVSPLSPWTAGWCCGSRGLLQMQPIVPSRPRTVIVLPRFFFRCVSLEFVIHSIYLMLKANKAHLVLLSPRRALNPRLPATVSI